MTAVAWKLTGRPEHMGLAGAEMVIDGVTRERTEMVTGLEDAVVGFAQVELLVRTQLIMSPSFRLLLVKVLLPAPAV